MRTTSGLLILALLSVATATNGAVGPAGRATRDAGPPSPSDATWFEPNFGQTDPGVGFVARVRGAVAFLTSGGATFATRHGALRMTFAGAASAAARAEDPLPGVSNYLLGGDASKWTKDVPHFGRVAYERVLPGVGVDWRIAGRSIAFDLDLEPGADPSAIRLTFEGADRPSVDAKGALVVEIAGGRAELSAPHAFQGARDVAAAFVVGEDGSVSFRVGPHAAAESLVIDPTLTFSTYLGGSVDEFQQDSVAVGPSDTIFLAGATYSTNYPVTAGAFKTAKISGTTTDLDAVVTKFNAGGSALVYSTYLGSTSDDYASAITVDSSGDAYVGGNTGSGTFPLVNPYQTTGNQFVCELNAAGNGLVWSTRYSGSPLAMALDGSNNLLFATGSHVVKFNSTGTVRAYDANLSNGSIQVALADVAADAAGNVWACGANQTAGMASSAALQSTLSGGQDGWLVELDASGNVVYGTYFGGSGTDNIYSIAFDPAGVLHIAGFTTSSNLPTSHAAQPAEGGGGAGDVFVAALDATGHNLLWSTYWGGAAADFATRARVTSRGETVVIGGSDGSGFPTANSVQSAFGGGTEDALYAEFAADGSVEQSSYLGGSGYDFAWNLAVTGNGAGIVVGQTDSTNFPTVAAYQSSRGGGKDDFVTALPVPASPYTDTSPVTLPQATVQTPYSTTLTIPGGSGTLTWTPYGSGPPAGLSLAANGALTGSPSSTGTSKFFAMIVDANHAVTIREFDLTVNAKPAVTTTSVPSWTATRPYDKPLAATGGTAPLTWAFGSGTLPPGAAIASTGAVTSAQLTNPGAFQFGVTVTDANGAVASGTVTMTVNPFPAIDSPASPDFVACTQTRPFSAAFTAADGTPPFAWSVVAGTFPVSSPIDPAAGTVDGTLTLAGPQTFTVRATDAAGAAADREYSIVVAAFPAIVTARLPWGAKGRAYSVPIAVTGGTAPLAWQIDVGSFPAGMSITPDTGTLAGTPTQSGRFAFGVKTTDACDASVARTYALDLADALDLRKPNARVATTFAAADGSRPELRFIEMTAGTTLSFSVSSNVKGDLPVGVGLFDANGDEIDLSAVSKTKKGVLRVKGFVVPATGRYFLQFLPSQPFDGTVTVQAAAVVRPKWKGDVTVDAAATPQSVTFSGLPGAKATITVAAPRGSAAVPTIASLKDANGTELLVPAELKLSKKGATLKVKTPLAGGDYTLTIVSRDGTSGGVAWSVGLKGPKGYGIELP